LKSPAVSGWRFIPANAKLARVFGTTWSVNAWVIAAVLGVILLTNALVQRWPDHFDTRLAYLGLVGCLLACHALPVDRVLHWPLAHVLITALYTSPLFFAGMIFATNPHAGTKPRSRTLNPGARGATPTP
jgi:hypothetical protein